MIRRTRVTLGAVLAALVLLFGGRWVALRYTEHAWYADLGLGAVYWQLLLRATLWRFGLFAAALAWYAVNTLAVSRSIGAIHLPRRVGNLEIAEAVPRTWLRGIAIGIAVILALATAYSFSDIDHYAALYRHAVPLGLVEPVLGKDAAFYLARLPLLELLQLAAVLSALLALLLAGGLYLLTGSLAISRRHVRVTPHARTHIVAGLAVLALALAWGFQLQPYQVVGGGGHFDGVLSSVDHAIRLPAANALALIALAVCVGTALSLRASRAPLVFFLWATLLVATLLGRYLVPAVAEAWGGGRAGADQLDEGWIRSGMSLDAALLQVIPRVAEPPAEAFPQLGAAAARFSPWSTAPGLLDALLPAAAGDTGIPREWVTSIGLYPGRRPGESPRLVALALGQTDLFQADRVNPRPGWRALHRGDAAFAGPFYAVDASAHAGPPRFFASLADSDTGSPVAAPLAGAPARIRFLPRPADLALIEGSAPQDTARHDTTALPGLPLGGFFRRLMFAWALQSPPLLGSGASSSDRLLFWRDVPTRLGRLYPFATFDVPRAALAGGRMLWVADGLLASPRYPLAPHLAWRGEDVSYLSAPYVATVDAEQGTTRLYLRPRATPFAASVARAEGIEPLPAESLPGDVARQLGYPAALLGPQAATFARIEHDSSGARLPWSVAWSDSAWHNDAGLIAPALVVLDIGNTPRLWSLVPLMDQAGTRLTAIVAGSADARGQTETRLITVPAGLPTPAAIRARLSSLPGAQAVAAFATPESGGQVRRGDVVPLPAAGTIVYAQGIFASERRTEPLQLRLIGVAAGARVGLGVDATDAARAAERGDVGIPDTNTGGALAAARAAFQTLDSAVRSADWTQVGRAYAQLKRALGLTRERQP